MLLQLRSTLGAEFASRRYRSAAAGTNGRYFCSAFVAEFRIGRKSCSAAWANYRRRRRRILRSGRRRKLLRNSRLTRRLKIATDKIKNLIRKHLLFVRADSGGYCKRPQKEQTDRPGAELICPLTFANGNIKFAGPQNRKLNVCCNAHSRN